MSFYSLLDPFVDFSGVTAELMGPFLMTDDVNQLEILSGEQEFVKIIHIYIIALIGLQCLGESRNDSPLLFYQVVQIPGAEQDSALAVSVWVY